MFISNYHNHADITNEFPSGATAMEVFNIPELFSLILFHSNIDKPLGTLRLTCRQFFHIAKSSEILEVLSHNLRLAIPAVASFKERVLSIENHARWILYRWIIKDTIPVIDDISSIRWSDIPELEESINTSDLFFAWRALAEAVKDVQPVISKPNYHEELVEFSKWHTANSNKLAQLQKLKLKDKAMAMLPAEIWQLSQLQKLYLSFNLLRELPVEIGQFARLRELDLGCNKIRKLPSQIGMLAQLQKLNLGYNELTELPTEIGQLRQLRLLILSRNKLTGLPTEIGQLTQLVALTIDKVPLTSFPAELSLCRRLLLLCLSEEQLTLLPIDFGLSARLHTLQFYNKDCDLSDPSIRQWIKICYLFTIQKVCHYIIKIFSDIAAMFVLACRAARSLISS